MASSTIGENTRRELRSPVRFALGGPRWDRAARILAGLLLIGAVLALARVNEAFRSVEASAATWALSPFVEGQRPPIAEHYFVRTPGHELIALRVTIECTTLLIGVPLTVVGAVILASTRVSWSRSMLGILAMWAIIFVVNVVRLVLIGWSTQTWGLDPGYEISHVFVGSVVGIIGYALGLAVLLLIVGVRPRRRRVMPEEIDGPQYHRHGAF